MRLFARLSSLWQRFAASRASHSCTGPALRDSAGRLTGQVDLISLSGNQLLVTGWSSASQLILKAGGLETAAQPTLLREDVAGLTGGNTAAGFRLRLPVVPELAELCWVEKPGDALYRVGLPLPGNTGNGMRLRFAFLAALCRAAPYGASWIRRRDDASRARFLHIMGLDATPAIRPLDPRLFAPPTVGMQVQQVRINIVLPVYNSFDLLAEVLERVRRHTDLLWRLILIEDCSTDSRVRPFLRDWHAKMNADPVRLGEVLLLENECNLGFVGSANRGLALAVARGDHTVLLNSDAFVPEAWASRLLRPILNDARVASVTPMSNDAEIFSVPVIVRGIDLEKGMTEGIDAVARRFDPDRALSRVPTGVGFCMALNAAFLCRLPAFDSVFGRGYGEEVDWCRKAAALGGVHLAHAGLFVEHRGGSSFGSDAKRALIAKNHSVIQTRYPAYDGLVQNFVTTDPLITARLALGLGWAAIWAANHDREIPVFIAHSLGGGAEKYLERRIAADLEETGRPSVVVRVGGAMRYRLELHCENGVVSGSCEDFDLVKTLMEPLSRRVIIYSCGVGDSDPVRLPGHILALAGKDPPNRMRHRIEVLIHDFFPISPSYTLLDADGVYRGPVTAGRDRTDTGQSHLARDPAGGTVPLDAWQAAWGELMRAADEIVVFSGDSRRQVLASYPDVAHAIVLRPHRLLAEVPPLPDIPRGGARVIAVLGAIGRHKGAGVLRDLGRLSARRQDLSFVLIGYIDPAYALPESIAVHGAYEVGDLPALVTRYGITEWLVPSIWPETFSFTTHEALATGLPVWAFDIGAQGEAVAAAENGRPIRFSSDMDLAEIVLDALTRETESKRSTAEGA